jgi:hypothetical protein
VTVGARDHVQVPPTASVTLVEYGDYECPCCRAAVAIVKQLQWVLPDKLRFVFRHFSHRTCIRLPAGPGAPSFGDLCSCSAAASD